jgi:serine/threonine-protein kinase ULK/ATG1
MKKMNSVWDEYKKIELIGSGSFADVYRAKNKKTNEYVAIKEIKKSKINVDDILKEIEIIKKLESENSVSLIDSIETEDCYYLILELCYISLEDYIKMRKKPLSIEEIRKVLLELNECLKEMKNKNIIHRDLKPSNILLSLNKLKINKICFKISDFGLSKLIEGSKMNKMSLNGTPITMSPEILKGEENLNLQIFYYL